MFFFRTELKKETFKEQIGRVQRMNFLAMVWMLNFLSFGFESNHALERTLRQNRTFLY